ncbi:hypothetical protein TWF696_005617 [Orbilia brochopaga]|uniref:Uncharacterized protein n=1 Tax=Orbilia brochopaga TaxID=3140254 RepID=A0AAV9V272_9PEZI
MPKHEQSTRNGEYRSRSRDRHERDRHDRDHRRRRHRSPSYDSYSSSDSDDSDYYSRSPSPHRRPSRRHTSAAIHSDNEDRGHRGRDRRGRTTREYHSEESPSRERGGIVEDLLAAIGLVQAKSKDRSRRDRSRSGEDGRKTSREALQAALTAAAMEAFRTRKEGKLTPQRLMQIAGAAIAAGGLDALVDRNGGNGGSMKSIIESVVAGLATGKTLGKTVKHRREGSVGDKVGTGFVGMATKALTRSLSQGPTRRRTNKY